MESSARQPTLRATLLSPHDPYWSAQIDTLWAHLGYPTNPALFPPYFVQTTFPKLGGRLFQLTDPAGTPLGAALLFPRTIINGIRYVTLRLHAEDLNPVTVLAAIEPQIAPDCAVLYVPTAEHTFHAEGTMVGAYTIGAPARMELAAISELQRAVWGAEAGQGYPVDLHSAEFKPGSSLVARADGKVVGFLFGFTRFTAPDGLPNAPTRLYLESQLLAIDPAHRRGGLAATLKRAQAQAALAAGMRAIHWTADPLQMANATLNFATLRAIAGKVYPSYYPFTNALNRVTASRLGVVWLPDSAHGSAGLTPRPRSKLSLADLPELVVLNDGPEQLAATTTAPVVALEIPTNWTVLQHTSPELAQAWRTTTDAILDAQLGFRVGKYVVTNVAQAGERCYLVAEAFRAELWAE